MANAPEQQPPQQSREEIRAQKIAEYGSHSELLEQALNEFPAEMWTFRDECGCWSVKEHLIHIADSEVNSYIRCRRIISEPGAALMAYDENLWTERLAYHTQSVEDTLALFKFLRKKTHALISLMPAGVWRHSAYHPEMGGMVTLDAWLDTYHAHVPEHIQYMRENLAAYQAELDYKPEPPDSSEKPASPETSANPD